MNFESLPILDNLPQDFQPLPKPKSVNIMSEIFRELLASRKLSLGDLHVATGIPMSTLWQWYQGLYEYQKTGPELLKLAQFFNVSLEYLCYGIGDDSAAFEKFTDDQTA